MRITEKTAPNEIYQKAYSLYKLRLLTILLLIPLYMLTCKWGDFTAVNLWPLFIVILVEVFLNKPYKIFFGDSRSSYQALIGAVFVDFLAETAALHLLGNVDLFIYTSCYFISIVYCALNLPATLTIVFATLVSALYASLILLGHMGVIPQTVSLGADMTFVRKGLIVIRHIAFFYLIAFFVRYLALTLIKKEDRLEDLNWELRETSEKVKYAYHLQTDYFARMSHEIRQPLNSILGFSQLLVESRDEPLTTKQRDFLSRIERGAKHLKDLINDVLDLSKVEAKKMHLSLQTVDLVKVVNTVLEVFYDEAMQKQLLLAFTDKPDTLKITGDELKLRQILYNLLSNALKFTKQGFIHVSLERDGDGARLTVEDSGPGIAAENLEAIFRPYEQAGRDTNKNVKGTGLGLAISKQFVEMHGGKIRAESEPGKGTRFVITLPAQPPVPNPEESADTPKPGLEI
ncbi:MAG TPA: HAMP domain-containing sensor histidine kinase [Candidatus Omnitrophota bacterium]|nr:HAMP domain-containing sensor histidine kinase [Candidatus Omnitrophota bacterium]HPS36357.1 HAMP domain-containing sensor histidine kinase [Candidatus Omnitrophota bacterium]